MCRLVTQNEMLSALSKQNFFFLHFISFVVTVVVVVAVVVDVVVIVRVSILEQLSKNIVL